MDAYGYNARNEVISARRTKSGEIIHGFNEDFEYDPIGNRISSTTYNELGEPKTSQYIANNLNQYTSRTVPGYAAVRGHADADATVTVNEKPIYRYGEYFFGSDEFDNSSSPVNATLEIVAVMPGASDDDPDEIASVTSGVYLAKSPVAYEYDEDGNQTLVATKTGLWRVTYNGENRPVRWERFNSSTPNTSTPSLITMTFDHQGRRREYLEVAANGMTNSLKHFTYDNYLQIANCNLQLATGNLQLFVWDPTEPVATRPLVFYQPNAPPQLYAHDGNKNISELISADDGAISAHYEYASFGEVILSSGDLALANSFRFSSEYADNTLSLVYYNYRHYDPRDGRWMGRDRLDDVGYAILTYNWCFNSPLIWLDVHGNAPQYVYPGVVAVYDPINGGRIIQSPDIDWGGGLSRGYGGISASVVGTISFLFGNHEFINSNGCSFYCIGLTTQLLGVSGGVSVGNGSALSVSIGEGAKVGGWSIGSLDGGIGLSLLPAQANLRLICLPLNDEDENGCPCKDKAPKSIFGVQ